MTKYLLFSDKLTKIGLFVKSKIIIGGRLFALLFKRRNKLEKISFGYYQKWQFDNAYLFLDFKFKNAVWFRIGKFSSYNFSKQVILDLENIHSDKINFEVFGFFQRQVFDIKINKNVQFNTQSFKTQFDNMGIILPQKKIVTRTPKIGLHIPNLNSTIETISVKQQNIELDYKPFKIQDFI